MADCSSIQTQIHSIEHQLSLLENDPNPGTRVNRLPIIRGNLIRRLAALRLQLQECQRPDPTYLLGQLRIHNDSPALRFASPLHVKVIDRLTGLEIRSRLTGTENWAPNALFNFVGEVHIDLPSNRPAHWGLDVHFYELLQPSPFGQFGALSRDSRVFSTNQVTPHLAWDLHANEQLSFTAADLIPAITGFNPLVSSGPGTSATVTGFRLAGGAITLSGTGFFRASFLGLFTLSWKFFFSQDLIVGPGPYIQTGNADFVSVTPIGSANIRLNSPFAPGMPNTQVLVDSLTDFVHNRLHNFLADQTAAILVDPNVDFEFADARIVNDLFTAVRSIAQ